MSYVTLIQLIWFILQVRDATFHLNALMEYSVIENQMERLEQIIDHQRRNVEKLHETCDQLEDIDMADYRMSDENFHKRLTDEQAKLVNTLYTLFRPNEIWVIINFFSVKDRF